MPRKRKASQGDLFANAKAAAGQTDRPSTFRQAVAARRSPRPRTESSGVEKKRTWLSATAIESMRRCPRCFWLDRNQGIRQPEGIVSRLANRFDVVIKRYFDLYRGTNELPPMVAGRVKGKLQHPFQEKYWHPIDDRYGYYGKLDECLVSDNHTYTPVDHKTASSDPNARELIPAYQFQLDSYAFLLEQNGRPTTGIGHLIYFFPGHGDRLHHGFPMEISVKTLKTNPDKVVPELKKAVTILVSPLPKPTPDCNFCTYVEQVKKF
ncbi:MAG: hypothetical protein HY421_01050 [Candidatus Kerfeldbacteria bacterium]|nr:hypothetical protein [Candidatus Kerfeldbacteria bacterium]